MDYGFLLSIASLVLAALALGRAYVPPQTRAVHDLRGRVEDLEHDGDELHKRLNKRSARENMDKARTAHVEKSERRDRIEEEALAVIERSKKHQPDLLSEDPNDPAVIARWRERAGLH